MENIDIQFQEEFPAVYNKLYGNNNSDADKLNAALVSLKIPGKCIRASKHRHLAFFDIALEPGAMVSKLERRTKEISLALRSKTLPIIKLLPEQGIVRLQVAISDADVIPVSDVLPNDILSERKTALPFVLGETDEGERLTIDFTKNPHILLAGGTGSGKSVALHTLIANAAHLQHSRARRIELFLCDPKRVEFVYYDTNACKKLVQHVAYDYGATISMLELIVKHMEFRYAALAKDNLSNVSECLGRFPYIVVIIDEVADLMLQDKKIGKFQTLIVKLAQKARAAGIHLVLATQRPSVDVLTGLIKANFPARLSCKVASRVDSQVILDTTGAETLLGRGDAIFQNPIIDRVRLQIAYTDPRETVRKYFN